MPRKVRQLVRDLLGAGFSEIASGGSVRHMVFHEPSREVWFGVDTGFVVRARLGE